MTNVFVFQRPPLGPAVEYPGRCQDRFEVRVVTRVDASIVGQEWAENLSDALADCEDYVAKRVLAALPGEFLEETVDKPLLVEPTGPILGWRIVQGRNFIKKHGR